MILLSGFFSSIEAVAGLDENGNQLSDVWENLYNAHSLVAGDDADGDSRTNLEESVAGTDPFDSTDYQRIHIEGLSNGDHEIKFETKLGRVYHLMSSPDLTGSFELHSTWTGHGGMRRLKMEHEVASKAKTSTSARFWNQTSANDFSVFDSLPDPDGVLDLDAFQTLPLKKTGFAAEIVGTITVPETRDYTFFLSSSGPARLEISSGDGYVTLAEIPETLVGITPGEFQFSPAQRSSARSLTQGEQLTIRLRYFALRPNQHAQIAWSWPGSNGPVALSEDLFTETVFEGPFVDSVDLFAHDYDSEGMGELSGSEGGIVSAPPGSGMSGMVQHVLGQADGVQDISLLDGGSTEHVYLTWQVQFVRDADHRAYFQLLDNSNAGSSLVGPNIRFEKWSWGSTRAIRVFGDPNSSGYGQRNFGVETGKTYRVEVLTTLSEDGFKYATPEGIRTVEKGTYDFYMSEANGDLYVSLTGNTFNADVSDFTKIDTFRLNLVDRGEDNDFYLDDFFVSSGEIPGDGYVLPSQSSAADKARFYRLEISENDQDGDGLSDSEEIRLGQFTEHLFFEDSSDGTQSDVELASSVLADAAVTPQIELLVYGADDSEIADDVDAYENNYPSLSRDDARIIVRRSGSLRALQVDLEVVVPEEVNYYVLPASSSDYRILDESGNEVTDAIQFAFGEVEKTLRIEAIDDRINEFPEVLTLRAAASSDGTYTLSPTVNGATINLYDLPDHVDNETLFIGSWRNDLYAGTSSVESIPGFMAARVNGTRTEIKITTSFDPDDLSSPQNNIHVHKVAPGPTPGAGPIVFYFPPIADDSGTEMPEMDGGHHMGSSIKGPFEDYIWDLTDTSNELVESSNDISRKGPQVVIDSLFRQNEETRLYINLHTDMNTSGEVMAYFDLGGGSREEPPAPAPAAEPGSPEYPLIADKDELEVEVRRFFDQATFGGTEDQVQAMLNHILELRDTTNPDYHRHTAFEAWIDAQMDPAQIKQTYMYDIWLASAHQRLANSDFFDWSRYNDPAGAEENIPARPATPSDWPHVVRDGDRPEDFNLSAPFLVGSAATNFAISEDVQDFFLKQRSSNELHQSVFQAMANGRDQLRQKMGFAMQQILVVSQATDPLWYMDSAMVVYQDMINAYAFSYFRDALGFVNWSPLMATYLSSLRNQKAADIDGDGYYDVYPDENLARENMQLFSIGLFELWPDGTYKLTPEGLPIPTYTNADITEFAKIITGLDFGAEMVNGTWGGPDYESDNKDTWGSGGRFDRIYRPEYFFPMKMFGEYHALGEKTFAGTTIDNRDIADPTEMGIKDLNDAIDWLAGDPYDDVDTEYDMVNSHVSTPAFISLRLIQRFTTSNPSREYLHRVATVFKDTQGNLAETLKAILLDPEARTFDLEDEEYAETFGKKRSALENFLAFSRNLSARSQVPMWRDDSVFPASQGYANPDLYLSEFGYPDAQVNNFELNTRYAPDWSQRGDADTTIRPLSQPTVFNFYSPDFSPAGVMSEKGLFAPELQVANEAQVIANINFFDRAISGDGLRGEGVAGQGGILSVGGNPERMKIDHDRLAAELYPETAPAPRDGRTSESIADEMLIDALDDRLMNGMFRLKYKYDPNDGIRNPREIIIDTITAENSAHDNDNDAQDRVRKLDQALYLILASPEFQIRK